MRQPPRLATLLLNTLAPGNPALAGDLAEEFRQRQARLWYWRQVVGAILAAGLGEIRTHPVAIVRGLLTGWIATWVFARYFVRLGLGFDDWLFERGIRWFYMHGYGLHLDAWMVAAFANAFSGSLAVRCYHGHRPLMAVGFAGTVLGANAFLFGRWLYYTATTPPPTYGPELYTPIQLATIAFVLLPAAALIGGLWAARTQSASVAGGHAD